MSAATGVRRGRKGRNNLPVGAYDRLENTFSSDHRELRLKSNSLSLRFSAAC
jgi:hypothetical protein